MAKGLDEQLAAREAQRQDKINRMAADYIVAGLVAIDATIRKANKTDTPPGAGLFQLLNDMVASRYGHPLTTHPAELEPPPAPDPQANEA